MNCGVSRRGGCRGCVGCGKARVLDNCVDIGLDRGGRLWLLRCLDLNVAEVRARCGLLVFIDHRWGNDEFSLLRSVGGGVSWSGLCGVVL